MAFKLDAKIPAGALAEKWSNHKAAIKVVSPANKRKLDIIIVGTVWAVHPQPLRSANWDIT